MQREAVLVVLRADGEGLTPEQSGRLAVLHERYMKLSEERVEELRGDVEFVLECLAVEDRRVAAAALNQLKQLTSREIDFDFTPGLEQRRAAVQRLREMLTDER